MCRLHTTIIPNFEFSTLTQNSDVFVLFSKFYLNIPNGKSCKSKNEALKFSPSNVKLISNRPKNKFNAESLQSTTQKWLGGMSGKFLFVYLKRVGIDFC